MTIVSALRTVVMVAADLDRTARFYAAALESVTVSRGPFADPAWLRLLGIDDRRAERLVMHIGRDVVVFVAVDPPGAAYPADSTATDLWFQHIAVVVGDMDRVFARVQDAGAEPISRQGPEQLPASAGGVRAYKFHDPDGHPLELLQFPPGGGPERWRSLGEQGVLGVDHSAIAVADAARSMAFFTGSLGLVRIAASVNSGPTQVSLDDVAGDVVDVVALAPARPTPHVELLGYRTGPRRALAPAARPADIAATRLVLVAVDLAPHAASSAFADGSKGVALSDPDGHRLIVVDGEPPL